MGKKAQNGEVNKSGLIRELLTASPQMSVKEVVSALAERNISITPNLVYYIKGKMKAKSGRIKRAQRKAANVAAMTGGGDVLGLIRKVKSLASEVGGLAKLKALVEALSE